MIRAVAIVWSAFCLVPLAMGQTGGVRAALDLSNARYCPSTKMLQFSAKITFTTESSQPTRVPSILGVDEIHVARSLDDLGHRIYEFGESRTWDLLNLSGQRLDTDFYSLQQGNSFFIDRDVAVFVGADKAGQSRLAPVASHWVMLVLGMPLSYTPEKTASAPQTIYGIRTQPAELSSGAIERLSEGCGKAEDSLK